MVILFFCNLKNDFVLVIYLVSKLTASLNFCHTTNPVEHSECVSHAPLCIPLNPCRLGTFEEHFKSMQFYKKTLNIGQFL